MPIRGTAESMPHAGGRAAASCLNSRGRVMGATTDQQDLRVRVVRPGQLKDQDHARWASWAPESPFFHPSFTERVARYRSDVEVAIIDRGAETVGYFPYHRQGRSARPVGMRMSDYHGPILAPGVSIDPSELLRGAGISRFPFNHLPTGIPGFDRFEFGRSESRRIDLSDGYEAWRAGRRDAGSKLIDQVARKRRKMEREVGPSRFEAHSQDRVALEALYAWKGEQRRRTRTFDVLGLAWVRELLEDLLLGREEGFGAQLSTLHAGDQLAAVHLGLRTPEVLHYWFGAYDHRWSVYSPGSAILIAIAQDCAAAGVRHIDLGRGDERYKSSLASSAATLREGVVTTGGVALSVARAGFHARRRLRDSPLHGVLRSIRARAIGRTMGGSGR